MPPHGKQGERVPGKGHDADLNAHPSFGIDLGDHVSRRPPAVLAAAPRCMGPTRVPASGRTGLS